MNKRIQKWLQQVSLKVVLLTALFSGALFLFAYIAHEAVYEQEDVFDTRVHTYLLAHATPAIVEAARVFTFGFFVFLLPVYVVLIGILIFINKKRDALDIAIVAASSFIVMQVLKRVFHRRRPDLPIIKAIHTYSFPSGHSLSAFIFCSILAYLLWKSNWRTAWKWLLTAALLFLAVSIGLSRIILNVHFATDVIAGFCLGIMWALLSFWITQKINRKHSLQQ